MDQDITNYDRALEAVDTSVSLLDLPTIASTLQRFPVLQVRASQRLICEIPSLIKVSGKTRLIQTLADAIGCILSPLSLSTVEGKLCATTLYYGIRDQDERLLQSLITTMLQSKRDCFGSGLFVQTVLLETLQLSGKLPHYLEAAFHKNDAELLETNMQSWKEVRSLLQRKGFIESEEGSPIEKSKTSFSVTKEGQCRLHLRIEERNQIRKRRKRKITTPFHTNPSLVESRKERQLLLKLVSLYAALPELVAEKVRAYGLQSYCSAKILALSDALSSSKGHQFTSDELCGMRVLGSANFSLSPDTTSMRSSSDAKDELSTELDSTAKDGKPLNSYKVWMPLTVCIESFMRAVQNGHHCINTILEEWNSAKGSVLFSLDQIMIAGLAHDRVLEDLLGSYFSAKQDTSPQRRVNSISDSQASSAIRVVIECFQTLDRVSERGFGYPIAFWGQFKKVFSVLESAIVLLLLRGVQNIRAADVNTLIIHSRNITKRLQDRVAYRRTEPRANTAAVKVCGCLSVELAWKDRRKLRCSVLRSCRCMIPNTMFLPIPKPSLWFFFVMHGLSEGSRKFPQGTKEPISVSHWLYRNPGWQNRDYCSFSKLEVVHGIVSSVLRDGSGVVISEVANFLIQVLKGTRFRNKIFSVFAECSKTAYSEVGTKCGEKDARGRLEILRAGVEKIWSIIGHESNESLFCLDTGISADELRHIEDLFRNVVPCLKGLHACVRDMPWFCEYVAVMYRLWKCGEDRSDELGRVEIITGLMQSQLRGRKVEGSWTRRQDGIFETVMVCFE